MQQSESIWSKVLPLQVIESRRGYDSNQTSQPLRKRGLSSSWFKHILPAFRLVILSCTSLLSQNVRFPVYFGPWPGNIQPILGRSHSALFSHFLLSFFNCQDSWSPPHPGKSPLPSRKYAAHDWTNLSREEEINYGNCEFCLSSHVPFHTNWSYQEGVPTLSLSSPSIPLPLF